MTKNIQELINYLEMIKVMKGPYIKVNIDGNPVDDFDDYIWTDDKEVDFLGSGKVE